MRKSAWLVAVLVVLGIGGGVMLALAESKVPVACAVLSEKEALDLVGGPLGEAFKEEELPTSENGYDHITVCGYFPKGYKIQEADNPPERGLQLQLHAMKDNAAAKSFYEHTLSMHQDMTKAEGSPFYGDKITPLSGTGEAAFLLESKIDSESGSSTAVATVTFLKGSVMGQVTAWKKGGSATPIAKNAATKLHAKLP